MIAAGGAGVSNIHFAAGGFRAPEMQADARGQVG